MRRGIRRRVGVVRARIRGRGSPATRARASMSSYVYSWGSNFNSGVTTLIPTHIALWAWNKVVSWALDVVGEFVYRVRKDHLKSLLEFSRLGDSRLGLRFLLKYSRFEIM